MNTWIVQLHIPHGFGQANIKVFVKKIEYDFCFPKKKCVMK